MVGDKARSPRIRSLGAELRRYRERAGLNLRELSTALGGHHSKYARFEKGERVPTTEQVAEILTVLRVDESERQRLVDMARRPGESDNWLQPGPRSSGNELTTLIEFEQTARRIVDVAPVLIPGLLQTADYARAVLSGSPGGEVDTRVTLRVGRRDVLMRRGSPELHAYIAETALIEPLGGTAVMAEQLRHVSAMGELPNVTVRVLPIGLGVGHPAHNGAFILFDFASAAPTIVHLEHLSSSAFLSDPKDVAAFGEAVDSLAEIALSPDESNKLVMQRARELEEREA